LQIGTAAPFELKAVNSDALGWKETVCVVCRNSEQEIKMDNQHFV